jgi:hypothetical protein
VIQVLATDNAHKHTAEQWGKATAYAICPFDETLDGQRKRCAEEMREKFQTILTRWHHTVQEIEQQNLAADPKYIHEAFGAAEMVECIMEELLEATTDTPWFYLWRRQDVREIISEIIESHIKTNQQHERMAYAHEHPDNEDARFFLNFFEKGQT